MPNLVIVDTPGFQPENKELRDLIRDQMLPPNRFIGMHEEVRDEARGKATR